MLTPTIPTAQELIGRARDLAPVIATRALECERLGRLPDDSFADFRDAGFYRILQPKRFGGYEHDMYTLLEVTREIGRSGCCSSAWVLAILAIHNFYLGYFPPRAQEDIWGEDQDTQTCTPFVPAGTITKVAGGIEIRDGRWAFASGCDHARFALLGVLVPDDAGGPPEYFQCAVPVGDYQIDHASWDVVALKGTGSKDITVSECFVPTHRMFSLSKVAQDIAPGREINTGPLYRQPFFAASVCSLIAPALGRGAGGRGCLRTAPAVAHDGVRRRQTIGEVHRPAAPGRGRGRDRRRRFAVKAQLRRVQGAGRGRHAIDQAAARTGPVRRRLRHHHAHALGGTAVRG